jgi:cell division protease FtsH
MVRLQRRMGTHNVQSEGPFVTKPNPPRGTRVLKRAHKLVLLLALVVSVGVGAWFLSARLSGPGPRQVALSDAVAQIQHPAATGLSTVWVDDTDHTVTLDTARGALVASYPDGYSGDLTRQALDAHLAVRASAPDDGGLAGRLLTNVLPVILVLALLLYLARSGSLLGGVGRFSGKRGQQLGEVPEDRFVDVAGADEAVAELREIVEFLKDGSRFRAMGARTPSGALLVGPPGTGKTLLARAVAGEAGVPFFAVAGSDFVEIFAGGGAKRVRDLFDRARAAGNAIVFIDEIDAVGRSRSSGPGMGGGDSERENTLISLLNEMDGFVGSGVVVLAATNRADLLDAALTRPGRLDRQIQVPTPDRRGREQILGVHAQGKPLAADVDLVTVARQTPGMSGADLARVVNEACLAAARKGAPEVTSACFHEAVASVALGRARTSALITEHDRRITAWHEAGHTIAALVQPDADDPVSVTIIPRGPSGGATWMGGNDNSFLTRDQARAQLTTSMAGRAAEEILLDGEHTQGAAGDLQAATQLAQAMVTQYGMTDFGFAQLDAETLRVGGEVAVLAHKEIDKLIREAHGRAVDLLDRHRDLLGALAAALLDEETVDSVRIHALAAEHGIVRAAAVPAPRQKAGDRVA